MKRQVSDLEEISAQHKSDKGSVCRTDKELLELNIKQTKHLMKTVGLTYTHYRI